MNEKCVLKFYDRIREPQTEKHTKNERTHMEERERENERCMGTMCKMNKRNRPRDQIFNPILSILCAL